MSVNSIFDILNYSKQLMGGGETRTEPVLLRNKDIFVFQVIIKSGSDNFLCQFAKRKTPLSPCPPSKNCPDMGLRTVFTVQKPK
ncbi:hypothetical protein TNCV_4662661 [Trichonephila clavipes]|uniref:Uncharacterized protein n=1 Tax=Trichonephila clavipes TaxID=2585209 RepID=A0A8X6SD53_TRICX|nr:hypothetical protein TNCV_4662661 [Trichonephila clavipes]